MPSSNAAIYQSLISKYDSRGRVFDSTSSLLNTEWVTMGKKYVAFSLITQRIVNWGKYFKIVK